MMLEKQKKFEKAFARLAKDYKPFNAQFGDKGPPKSIRSVCVEAGLMHLIHA